MKSELFFILYLKFNVFFLLLYLFQGQTKVVFQLLSIKYIVSERPVRSVDGNLMTKKTERWIGYFNEHDSIETQIVESVAVITC